MIPDDFGNSSFSRGVLAKRWSGLSLFVICEVKHFGKFVPERSDSVSSNRFLIKSESSSIAEFRQSKVEL